MKKILISFLLLGWLVNLSAQTIQRIEYFIDTDPGYGAAILVPFSGTSTANANLSIPLISGLSDGIHKIYIRAKDSNGRWSMVQSQNFFKIGLESSAANITKLEYFIDTDPGLGLAVNVPIIQGLNSTKELNIPLPSNLPLGFHKFYIRAKDAAGKWSVVFSQNFFKSELSPNVPNLVKLEYFVDTDPGFGNATPIPINPSQTVNLENINLSLPLGLAVGEHVLYIRGQDALGKWSIVSSPKFMNCPTGTLLSVIGNPYKCSGTTQMSAAIPVGVNSWVWLKDNAEIEHSGETSISVSEGGNYSVKTQTGLTNACSTQVSNVVKVVFANEDSLGIKTNRTLINCNQPATLSIDSTKSNFSAPEFTTFQWFKDNVSFTSGPNATVITKGIYKLRVSYSGPLAACTVKESQEITLSELPVSLNISPISHQPNVLKLCTGSSVDFLAETSLEGNQSFQWFRNDVAIGGATQASLTNISQAGSYKYQVSVGSCHNLTSGVVEVQLVTGSGSAPSISLTSGTLNACPGSIANLSISSCSGTTIWSNQVVGTTLDVIQLNSAQTYSAYCLNSCMYKSNNSLTFLPLPATIPAPKILTDLPPYTSTYTVKQSSRTHGDAFRYNNYDSPLAIAPLQGGTSYYIDNQMTMNAFLPSGALKFPQIIVHNVPNTNAADIASVGFNKLLLAGDTPSGITGLKTQAGFGGNDIWLLWRDIEGNYLMDKTFGGNGGETGVKILKKTENEIFIVATSTSGISGNKTTASFGNSDIWVIKIDGNGNKLAEASFGGSSTDAARDAILLNSGSIAILGSSSSGPSGNKTSTLNSNTDLWLLQVDANLNLVWERSLALQNSSTNAGKSLIEKNGHIFVAQEGGRMAKYDLSGNLVANVAFNFTDHNQATSSGFSFKNLLKGPNNEMVAIGAGSGNVSMNVNSGTLLFVYSNIISFEFDENMLVNSPSRKTYGSYYTAMPDTPGRGFYDSEGQLNILHVGDVPACSTLVGNTYFADHSAYYNVLCNRGNITDGHWFLWKMGKYTPTEQTFTDYCKGKVFALQASYLENFPLANGLEFKWSNGQTGQHIEYISNTSEPLYAFVNKPDPNTCGSPVVKVQHTPYPDNQTLGGNQGTDRKRYTYQYLVSTEKIQNANTEYRAGSSILLNPGFVMVPSSGKPFKAEIGGCVN
ncbi:3-coathanger stack domain-containing protein [Lacihabitans soyangensis]|uniref:Ig-like domain-containing protein n=1 Tax=Lacihabitans soyangensis TaxID=869394 RepID=A0AAE3KWV9_9BACT|nr:3-coathanger stack domain-containing protein [Lacihabitans soyangensis]MCP9763570.1 hypothetical protein [Lacihabitans soyangensis]